MLPEDQVYKLNHELQRIARFADGELIERPDWGTIRFEEARQDIDIAIRIAHELLDLPLKHLTSSSAQELASHLPSVVQALQDIDQFSILGADRPGNAKKVLCKQLHRSTERLQDIVLQLLPYLAYRHSNLAENKDRIEQVTKEAKRLLDQTKSDIESRNEAISGIVRTAQEAAASVGVEIFAADFDAEAKVLRKRSKWWLLASALLGGATILAAIGSYFWPPIPDDAGAWETLRNVGSKAATLAVLFTSAVWCGRIYRALVHQATVNKHRAMSLSTFQTFFKSAGTEEVRDAILLAATNAAFGSVPTGFVEQSAGQGPAVNVTEISKRAVERVSKPDSDAES